MQKNRVDLVVPDDPVLREFKSNRAAVGDKQLVAHLAFPLVAGGKRDGALDPAVVLVTGLGHVRVSQECCASELRFRLCAGARWNETPRSFDSRVVVVAFSSIINSWISDGMTGMSPSARSTASIRWTWNASFSERESHFHGRLIAES